MDLDEKHAWIIYIYIGGNVFAYMGRKLMTFQPELDGDKLGRNLSLTWQSVLVGEAGSVFRAQKTEQSLGFCEKFRKHQRGKKKKPNQTNQLIK